MAHPASAAFYQSRTWKDLRRRCLERDGYRCAIDGCTRRAVVADHVTSRPHSRALTEADTLGNLRSLCLHHDAMLKETGAGARRNDGVARVKGCDAGGWPLAR